MKFKYSLARREFDFEADVESFHICNEALWQFGISDPDRIHIRTKKKEGYHKVKLRVKVRRPDVEVDWKCPSIGVDEWSELDTSLASWLMLNVLLDRGGNINARGKVWVKFE